MFVCLFWCCIFLFSSHLLPTYLTSIQLQFFIFFSFQVGTPYLNNFIVLQTTLSRFLLLNLSDFGKFHGFERLLNKCELNMAMLTTDRNKGILEISGNIGLSRTGAANILWDWRPSVTSQITWLEFPVFSLEESVHVCSKALNRYPHATEWSLHIHTKERSFHIHTKG